MAIGQYEEFLLTLLLCAPSNLSRAWTNNETFEAAQAELDALPLSEEMRERCMKFMTSHPHMKGFFRGIADVVSSTYAGPEPHPDGTQAAELISRLMK